MASSTIEEAVKVYALADASLTTLIGQRLYWIQAEDDPTLPYVTYQTISAPYNGFAFDNFNAGAPRIQFSAWSEDRYIALSIGNIIKRRWRWFNGTIDSVPVMMTEVTGPVVIKEGGGGVTGTATRDIYQAVVDVIITYSDPV